MGGHNLPQQKWARDGILIDRMIEQAREWKGDAWVVRRAIEIAQLPVKDWRGRAVFRIMCEGPFGRGPHENWVPEHLLWNLLDLGHYCCPYHR